MRRLCSPMTAPRLRATSLTSAKSAARALSACCIASLTSYLFFLARSTRDLTRVSPGGSCSCLAPRSGSKSGLRL